MSSITFSIVHLYLLKEMSTYLVIQIEHVHFLFSIYSLQQNNHICVNCVNIYKLLLRGSVFRVNIYCILCQEPLQKTLCESILFIFSPYCTRCSLMRIKLSCLGNTARHRVWNRIHSRETDVTVNNNNQTKNILIHFLNPPTPHPTPNNKKQKTTKKQTNH